MSPRTTAPAVSDAAVRLRLTVVPLARQLRQQATGSFTPTQLSVFGTIHRDGPLTLGELATRERLSPPTISTVVAGLEEAGMIERNRDPRDRRVCRVQVSASGEKWIRRARKVNDEWLAARLAALDPEELAALVAAIPVLERLVADTP